MIAMTCICWVAARLLSAGAATTAGLVADDRPRSRGCCHHIHHIFRLGTGLVQSWRLAFWQDNTILYRFYLPYHGFGN